MFETSFVRIGNTNVGGHFGHGTKTWSAIWDWSYLSILPKCNTKQSMNVGYNILKHEKRHESANGYVQNGHHDVIKFENLKYSVDGLNRIGSCHKTISN